jgi:hypothetical protein
MTSVYADLDGQIVRRFPNTSNYAHSPSGWKRRVDCGNDDKYVSVEKPFANHGAKMGFLLGDCILYGFRACLLGKALAGAD